MWRVMTAIGAAAVAVALIVTNLAPANARSGGPGPGSAGGHPPAVQHVPMSGSFGPINPCSLPSCKGGSFRAITPGGPGSVGLHPPTTQHLATGDWHWHQPCNDPMCHNHHHYYHRFNNFVFLESNGPYIYQPEPDCWLWSHRLHRWIWACGPYYPGY
jgi:hypothetical protein